MRIQIQTYAITAFPTPFRQIKKGASSPQRIENDQVHVQKPFAPIERTRKKTLNTSYKQ